MLGDTTRPATISDIPDRFSAFVFSLRAPSLTHEFAARCKPEGTLVIELAQDYICLKELFGRRPQLSKPIGDPD